MDKYKVIRIEEVVTSYYKKHILEVMPSHKELLGSCLNLVDIAFQKEKKDIDLTKGIEQIQGFRIRNPEGLINSKVMQLIFSSYPEYKPGMITIINNMYQVTEYNLKVLEAMLKETTALDNNEAIEKLYLSKTKEFVPKEVNILALDSLVEAIKIVDDFVNGKGQIKKKITLVGLKGFLKSPSKGYISHIIDETFSLIKKNHDAIPKMIEELKIGELQYLDKFYSN